MCLKPDDPREPRNLTALANTIREVRKILQSPVHFSDILRCTTRTTTKNPRFTFAQKKTFYRSELQILLRLFFPFACFLHMMKHLSTTVTFKILVSVPKLKRKIMSIICSLYKIHKKTKYFFLVNCSICF